MKVIKGIKESDIVFLDIESARSEKVLKMDTQLFNAWKYKQRNKNITDLEVIQTYQTEASLFAEFSTVVSIVLGVIRDNKIVTVVYDNKKESQLLGDVNEHINSLLARNPKMILSGWNISGFDLPFIFKRMLINGIEPSEPLNVFSKRPWEVVMLDLMSAWKGTSFTNSSLTAVAAAFNLPTSKDDISGAQVSEVYWDEGVSRISNYCKKDVELTINIYRKMTLQEVLEPVTKPVEIKTEKLPILTHLFNGGNYGKKEKDELQTKMKGMSDSDKAKAKVILNAMVSTAKGKQTSLTKKDVKVL